MKNIIKAAGILLIALCSCKKFLDVLPETAIAETNFYKSQADFEQAVVGVYQPLQSLYLTHYQVNEQRSDNTFFEYDLEVRSYLSMEEVNTFDDFSTSVPLASNWTDNYKIIERANAVLKYIDNVTFDQTVKDNLKGQVLFLRALTYFDLVKTYGDVPLFLVPPTTIKETFIPRSPVADVYTRIIADATSAATLLPSNATQTVGRATSGAAYTLLADVYMTLQRWSDAKSALESVMSMGYTLLPNYRDVFDPLKKGNNEMIFEVQYTTNSVHNLYSSYYNFLPALTDLKVIIPSLSRSTAGGLAFNVPTPDLIASYEDKIQDKRFNASIAFYSGPESRSNIIYHNFPYTIKYLYPHTIAGQTDQDWPVYRYAEVLLMYAEVLNELNNTSDAIPYLNQVRNRAGLNNTTATTQSALRDVILHERQIELAFEDKRWHDLVRSGKAIDVMNAFGARVKANPAAYYYPTGTAPYPSSFNVTANKLIFPIPVHEIITNPALVQNPGYE